MTNIALVPLEGLHELLMTTGHHPTGPPVVGGSPPQDLCLELGYAGDRHGPLPLCPLWCVSLGQALLDTRAVCAWRYPDCTNSKSHNCRTGEAGTARRLGGRG
jgi:hypothetical protein